MLPIQQKYSLHCCLCIIKILMFVFNKGYLFTYIVHFLYKSKYRAYCSLNNKNILCECNELRVKLDAQQYIYAYIKSQ